MINALVNPPAPVGNALASYDYGAPGLEGAAEDANAGWQQRYALPDWQSRLTRLPPVQERQFQAWAQQTGAQPDNPEYDMRGYWLHHNEDGMATQINPNDHRVHYPDRFKTPLARSFSNESIYANPRSNPPRWNDRDQLVDHRGRVLYDERAIARAQQR